MRIEMMALGLDMGMRFQRRDQFLGTVNLDQGDIIGQRAGTAKQLELGQDIVEHIDRGRALDCLFQARLAKFDIVFRPGLGESITV